VVFVRIGVTPQHTDNGDAPREMKVRFNCADHLRQNARTVRGRRARVWRRSSFCVIIWVEVSTKQLEEYFDFLAPNDIRIKGHRIGIETILYDYLFRERTPEQIVQRFPSLTLEQVHATILYYLHNREKVSAYIQEWLEWSERVRAEQDRNPPPVVVRLRALMAEREQAKQAA
jgi:uncharacterized protein (DUF433 family)